jgi:hypothetical protein
VGSERRRSQECAATGEMRRLRPFAVPGWSCDATRIKAPLWPRTGLSSCGRSDQAHQIMGVPTAGSRQLVEQPPRFSQVGGVEAFGKRVVDGRDQVAGLARRPCSPHSRVRLVAARHPLSHNVAAGRPRNSATHAFFAEQRQSIPDNLMAFVEAKPNMEFVPVSGRRQASGHGAAKRAIRARRRAHASRYG